MRRAPLPHVPAGQKGPVTINFAYNYVCIYNCLTVLDRSTSIHLELMVSAPHPTHLYDERFACANLPHKKVAPSAQVCYRIMCRYKIRRVAKHTCLQQMSDNVDFSRPSCLPFRLSVLKKWLGVVNAAAWGSRSFVPFIGLKHPCAYTPYRGNFVRCDAFRTPWTGRQLVVHACPSWPLLPLVTRGKRTICMHINHRLPVSFSCRITCGDIFRFGDCACASSRGKPPLNPNAKPPIY